MIETPQLTFDPVLHKYHLGQVELPSVTGILDALGLISFYAKDEAAAFRGTMAHLACRYLLEKRLDWSSVGQLVMPYVVSLDRWLEASGFEPEACEVMGYSPVYLFAGTYDVRGKHPKIGRCLFDLKTGEQCALWHRLQTVGYEIIDGGHYRRGCLHLSKTGKVARFVPHREAVDRQRFMACNTVFRLKEAA